MFLLLSQREQNFYQQSLVKNCMGISSFCPNFLFLTKFQVFVPISGFCPNYLGPNFRFLSQFQVFVPICVPFSSLAEYHITILFVILCNNLL